MDINIDALYNILKQNQESKGSDDEDISDLKNITALLAKAFKRKKYYAKPTNNNLRTSSASSSANKKPEYVKSVEKKKDKIADEKKRDMSKVKCYNCKKEGHFAKDCKKAKVKDYNYYKTKMLLGKKDNDEQVLLAEDKLGWSLEINANMVFMAKMEKVLSYSDESSSSTEETIAEEKNNEFNEQMKVLNEKNADLLAQMEVLQDQLKIKHVVIDTHTECQVQYAKLEEEIYEYMIRYFALCENDKQHRKKIDEQEILFDKMSRQLVEMNNNVLRLQDKILEKETKILELEGCVSNKDLEIEKCLKRLNDCENKLHKIAQTNQTIHMIMPSKDKLYNGRKTIGSENPSYFALEIEKFKRARENKIEFAYGYGNLNASYVNEKIKFSDDYFQEIINPDFEKIDSPFHQTSSLKPYVPTVILEKIIIDLEDEVICLWIIDLGCSKHKTGNHALLTNFMERFLRTVRFGNNDFAVISGYGDVVIGSMTIKKVYYVKGLRHNLFSVGQFRDKGLEVAFRKSTCYVRNEDGVDLLTSDRSSNLYTVSLNEVTSNSSACLLSKASSSQSWLWHQHLSHFNFATINNLLKNNLVQGLPKMKFKKDHLCSACEQEKIHQKHHKSKTAFTSNKPLYLLHIYLCGSMRVESIN
nr:integrase, catalytic region, zinc finger, CCHC-type, peptidase aspartic, catalytic [Tanacetum cinerariifolium]